MEEKIRFLIEQLGANDITVSEETALKLYKFYEMVVAKNEHVNLTSITEYTEFVSKHIIDSLILSKYIEVDSIGKMIDIGSGAGFPSIPLKIVHDTVDITSIDSVNKKIDFQNEVINGLHLEGMTALHTRAEDLASDPGYREQYDVCISRAVADLRVLSEYCLPFVKEHGLFVAYKSEEFEKELDGAEKAIKILGGKVIGTEKFEIDGNGRSFIIIEKIKKTNSRYPRKAGVPTKHPL